MPIKERRTKIMLMLFLMGGKDLRPVKMTSVLSDIFDVYMNQKTKGTLSAMLRDGYLEKLSGGGEETSSLNSGDGEKRDHYGEAMQASRNGTEYNATPPSTNMYGREGDTVESENMYMQSDPAVSQPYVSPSEEALKNEKDEKAAEYALTEKGFDMLCLQFPAFRYIREEWDGIWRIISYEIPEDKRHLRDRLRREMKGWGLGPWHRSFWVTSHPVISNLRQLVYGREEAQYIQAFESTHMFGDMDMLIEKVWNKNALEGVYKELFRSWHTVLSKDIEKSEKLRETIYEYVKVLRNDPGLPQSLVGRKWIGYEAFSIFEEMRMILIAQ